MKLKILIVSLAILLFAGFAFADSCVYSKRNHGKLQVHKWEWTSTDGTFDLDDTTSNSRPIWGYIVGVHFDPGPSNPPDSDYTAYLYDDRMDFDWVFNKGLNLDGTSRTDITKNVRTPLTPDDSYPILYGIRLRPHVTGPGAGTRQGVIYLIVKLY